MYALLYICLGIDSVDLAQERVHMYEKFGNNIICINA